MKRLTMEVSFLTGPGRRLWLAACVALMLLLPQGGISQSSAAGSSSWDLETSFLFTRPEFTWGRDPFGKKPGFGLSMEKEPSYDLSAVLFEEGNSEAIINDQRVRVGDEIGWRIVEEIGPNYVLLSFGSESIIELNLPVSRGAASKIQLEEAQK